MLFAVAVAPLVYSIGVFFLEALDASSDRQLKSMTVCCGSADYANIRSQEPKERVQNNRNQTDIRYK